LGNRSTVCIQRDHRSTSPEQVKSDHINLSSDDEIPDQERIGELKGNQAVARRCYNISLKKVVNLEFLPVSIVSGTSEAGIKGVPTETLEEVVVGNGKVLKIGSHLKPDIREGIIDFLRENVDSFAWTHEDMLGIDPEDIIHCLNTNPEASPIKQKRRKFASERNLVIAEEVEKLLKARFIREVYYPDWLANVVLVKKSNGKWHRFHRSQQSLSQR
jgi:hypothetical protein